ncbi:hypothetical protein CHCC14820_2139 [Bacillus paralicheniformis]|uniref:Uncharacterized protein n=1 Tax=Bacillus paralicheniformis TaxID=1648923 RepID=A0ABY3FTK7_9BACI|nr:hypothetical protein CHCC5022_3649 [Bacillus paralicheniformis]TWJ68968.1 hypothetical protein CHCC4186_2795 [Bacillus paralicheniformis]TWJ76539.1 hypothetical protein CHCC20497_0087 [Bacillus paralicheniformis]TWK26956.1 hypothetical protein CHCC20372_2000 [Bacillus paralicheniformis]TWK36231.1 hypothetical protein CHCC20348_1438 [Bacillus paralicheniformis]
MTNILLLSIKSGELPIFPAEAPVFGKCDPALGRFLILKQLLS